MALLWEGIFFPGYLLKVQVFVVYVSNDVTGLYQTPNGAFFDDVSGGAGGKAVDDWGIHAGIKAYVKAVSYVEGGKCVEDGSVG